MVKQIITDEESKLKRQARRRLIGAISLTVLVVVLLPMVLDSEPPAPSQDIELKIPDKDKVGEFVPKMVLPPLNETASQPASAAVIVPLLDNRPSVENSPSMAEIKPAPAIDMQPAAVAKPVVSATPKVEPKPVSKPSAKQHSGFVIQVGAFANADTAKKLQEKLHQQGYPSYTEKSGDKTRVRLGDYTTHAEAEKVRRKLEIQGMQPDVVSLK